MCLSYNIYEEKELNGPDVVELEGDRHIDKIGENAKIEIRHYRKKGETYYVVIFKIDEREVFLGKFPDDIEQLKADYVNGKILIFTDVFDQVSGLFKVDQVFSLYDILDDTFYSCTEAEALKTFDPFVDRKFLKNKDRLIARSDIEKKKRNGINK